MGPLLRKGKHMAITTILRNTEKTVSFAGEEFARYLSQMLPKGEVFSVSLEVSAPYEQTDGFSIDMTRSEGRILGNNPRSVLLAVYDYLHRLGCRFLTPQKSTEVIPSITREKLPAKYHKTAAFMHRGVCIEGANSVENIIDFVDWLPKVGYNSFFLQFKVPYIFLSRWYHHDKNPYEPSQPFCMTDAQHCMERIEREVKKRGLLLHKVGHGWTGEVLCGQATGSWDKLEYTLSEEQKQMTALVDGKRGFYEGIPTNTNLCLSNPAAVDKFVDLVVTYAEENPESDFLHIWLADDYNNVCCCDRCRQTTLSEQYVQLLNRIDHVFTQKGIQTRLVFLLYQELLWPAVKNRLINQDRFVMMFAPISRTFEASYDLSLIRDHIPEYRPNAIVLPTDIGENLAFLQHWQRVFDGESFIYDYPLGRAHYGDFGYLHISRIIAQDIKKLKEMKLDGYISCQELRCSMPNSLPNYMMGYMLMDECSDTEALIDEYFEAAYPESPLQAKTFLEILSELSSCDYVNGKGERINSQMAQRFAKIKEACVSYSDKPLPEGIHWEILQYHCGYIYRMADALEAQAKGDAALSKQKYAALQEYICKNEQKYQPWLDVYRVMEVTGKYTGLKL